MATQKLLLQNVPSGIIQDIPCSNKAAIVGGSECIFFPTGRTSALKIYPTKKSCQYAFLKQSIAHSHNFAPEVLTLCFPVIPTAALFEVICTNTDWMGATDIVDFIQKGKKGLWAYETQRIPGDNPKEVYEVGKRYVRMKLVYKRYIEQLEQLCYKHLKAKWYDNQVSNMRVYKGKPMIIDFGPLSFKMEIDEDE